jgi:hypothetical protein
MLFFETRTEILLLLREGWLPVPGLFDARTVTFFLLPDATDRSIDFN